MPHTLPGTTIVVEGDTSAQTLLPPLFLAGGLTLSQVAQLTALEPYVIQNWVRRGFLPPPQRKRYNQRQFCRIALINALKDTMQLDKICDLLSYVNGHLDDESDDLIDDVQLYYYVCRLAAQAEASFPTEAVMRRWCAALPQDYTEPVPGARLRVEHCLHIVLTAYLAAQLKRRADALLAALS